MAWSWCSRPWVSKDQSTWAWMDTDTGETHPEPFLAGFLEVGEEVLVHGGQGYLVLISAWLARLGPGGYGVEVLFHEEGSTVPQSGVEPSVPMAPEHLLYAHLSRGGENLLFSEDGLWLLDEELELTRLGDLPPPGWPLLLPDGDLVGAGEGGLWRFEARRARRGRLW